MQEIKKINLSLVLNDVARFMTSKIDISEINETKYISTENMISNKGGITIANSLPNSKSVREYLPEDILINNIRPYFKKIWYSDMIGGCSSDVFVIRSKENYDSKFLYYVLSSDDFFSYVMANAKGTKMPRGDKKAIQNYEVPNFSIDEQKKISKVLDGFDKKIAINKKINKNLEEQLSLLFNDWFVNCTPFKNEELIKSEWSVVPESWKDIEFGELIEITSGNRPDEKSEDKTSEFNIPLFGASKIMGYTKEYSYNEDILIIGRVGTHGVVQRVNYPCFPSDNTFVIKSDYCGFVYQLLKRIDYDSLNTGSTQPLITQKSLKSVNTILPDEKILSKFEMISKTIFDKIQLNNDEISNLTKLRDTLLPKLMSGEIDVSKINCDLELKYNYMKYLFNQIHTPMSNSVV